MLKSLLYSYLENLHDAGENANDFFNLFKLLIKPPEWKRHLVACGILEKVTGLIVEVFSSLLEVMLID